jgi:hypothetical protein
MASIGRLWDDPAREVAHRAVALESARRFGLEALAGRYLTSLVTVTGKG